LSYKDYSLVKTTLTVRENFYLFSWQNLNFYSIPTLQNRKKKKKERKFKGIKLIRFTTQNYHAHASIT